jgi:uncharacterized membrane protein YccC
MRIDEPSDRSLPRTLERALTALIQGRNAIEKARREVTDAIEIFSGLREEMPGDPAEDAERLLRLRQALDQLDASRRQLLGPDAFAEPVARGTAVGGR